MWQLTGRSALQVVGLTVILLCSAARCQDVAEQRYNGNKLPVSERQFQKAMSLRRNRDATRKDLRHAAALLIAAAGVQLPAALNVTAEADIASDAFSSQYTSGLQFSDSASRPALMELARAYEAGEGVTTDLAIAHDLYKRAAELGDPDAQADMAVRLALGLQPLTGPGSLHYGLGSPDVPAALLNYYFAAAGNDSFAQMALGYRHMYGVDAPQNCQAGLLYYNPAAEQVVEAARYPGRLPQVERVRLNYKSASMRRPSREQEVLHYQWFADLGSVEAQRAVGQIFSHGAMRNPEQALRYFRQAAEGGDADAHAHLGHMYANGVGVDQNNDTAKQYFQGAADAGNPSGQFGLGYMYLTGQSVEQDHRTAFKLFQHASEAGNAEAWFHMGVMYLNGWGVKPSHRQALECFTIAAQVGHVLGMYNLAVMHLNGRAGLPDVDARLSCPPALALMKKIAEKGSWGGLVQQAYEEFMDGNYESAMCHYLQSAEMGSELGQSNAAWMLSHGYGHEGPHAAQLAITLYQRAAEQGNHEALLEVGDSYYYGRGVPRDWPRAAQVYGAASKHRIAQASYNLGFMHEFGAGLPQDLHLAKRYYDKALEAQPDTWVPVLLALCGLWVHQRWLNIKPYLPDGLGFVKQRMFVLPQAEQGAIQEFGGSSGHVKSALGVVDRAFDWVTDMEALAHLVTDQAELFLLVSCGAGLWLVLQRRRRLRNQQAPVHEGPRTHEATQPQEPPP